jgi:cystathionine beta-synthase
MRERQFLDDEELSVKDIIDRKKTKEFVTVDSEATLGEASKIMRDKNISQIPVTNGGEEVVGSITESTILKSLLENPYNKTNAVNSAMGATFPKVDIYDNMQKVTGLINKENSAVMVTDVAGLSHIITEYDLIEAMS